MTAKRIGNYVLSLIVENVRCFGSAQTLDLTDKSGGPAQWTVILGANGTGKTTLLRALAIVFAYPQNKAIYDFPVFQRNSTEKCLIKAKLAIGCQFGKRKNRGIENIKVEINHTTSTAGRDYTTKALPCIAAYGASRKLLPGEIDDQWTEDPVASLFSNAVSLRDPQRWLLRSHYSALRKGRSGSTRQFDQIRNALVRLLPEVDDIRIPRPKRNEPVRVEFKSKGIWIDIAGLSLGYQTFAAWTVDFASRLFEWYPNIRNPLAEPAICLVDEIDLHMHPGWQRNVMDHLSEVFPRTQFIATAHSPLVVQAAAGANLAVLRWKNGEVTIDNDPEVIDGWRIDQVLTSDLFGLESARSAKVETLMKERVKLLQKSRLTAPEKQRLAQLNTQVETLPDSENGHHAKVVELIEQAAAAIEGARGRR